MTYEMVDYFLYEREPKTKRCNTSRLPSLAEAGVFTSRCLHLTSDHHHDHHHAEKQPLSVSVSVSLTPTPIVDLKSQPPAIQPR